MKLIYIANSRIPTAKAHGFQIMKMCEAFSLLRINTDTRQIFTDKEWISADMGTDFHGLALLYEDLTYKIRGAVFNVYNALGFGHKESVYQNALDHELRKSNIAFESQKSVDLFYDEEKVGVYRPDFIIDNKIIIELKSSRFLTKSDKEQVLHYLKGSNYKLALLINFGASKLQIERLINTFNSRESISSQIRENPSLQNLRKSEKIDVELWLPRRFNPIKENPFVYYGIREIFIIKKIPIIDLIPLYKILGPLSNLIESFSFAVFNIWRLSKTDFDIIYSRDQFTLWFLSFLNYKFVYEMHKMPRHPGFYRKIWRKAKKIITITAILKNAIVKEGAQLSKILVAHDGVDLDAFKSVTKNAEELKIELNLPTDSFLVGYVGKFKTLEQEKGLKTMIEALSILDKETKMAFVGGSESELKEYKSLAQRFNVLSQCVFIGHQPYRCMVLYMKAMDAVVLPSPDKPLAHYSSPLKLFEYMASGRPIIASDLPAIREVLNDKNTLFFKPENGDDLARAIKMLKASPTLGYHLSRQALADVKEYTWDNRAKNILEFFC